MARSVDGGRTWEFPIWTGRSTDSLGSVSFADAKVGWAVGARGNIFKTSDGGRTWDRRSAPAGFYEDLYSVKATSPTHVAAVGESGAILLTDDGGHSWTQPSANAGFGLFGVDFGTAQDGVAVGDGGTILRTVNGGSVWIKVDTKFDVDLKAVAFYGSRTVWAAGEDGAVLRSTDGGLTWSRIATETREPLYGVAALNGEGAIVVGNHHILSTADARTWVATANPLNTGLESVAASQSGLQVAIGYAGSILASDGHGRWKAKTLGGVGLLNDLHLFGERAWIAGGGGELVSGYPGGLYEMQTFRQGAHWERIASSPEGKYGLVIGYDGALLKSDDGGQSWRTIKKLDDPAPRLLDGAIIDGPHAWLSGSVLWRTVDGGRTWARLTESCDHIAFVDATHGVCARYRELYFTEDAGVTWTRADVRPADVAPDLYVDRIRYVGPDRIWAVGGSGIMLHSEDGGRVWSARGTGQLTDFADVNFLNDRIHGWVVGMDGLLGTTADAGETWKFKKVRDHVLKAIDFRDVENGVAVGWGGKIIETSDGGKNWVDYEAPWWPSRWYYVSWLLVGLVAAPAFRRPRSDAAPDSTIANRLVSDRPLEAGEQDALGLSNVAHGLSRFLRNANTVPPVTVAITGGWGSGKSSLMNLLAADLRANGFRPVFFNAWHSQQEASVLASLLEAIRKKGLPSVSTVEGLLFRIALLLRRCRRHWISLSLLGAFLAASAGLLEVRPPWLTDLWSSFVGSLPAFARSVTAHSGKDAGDVSGWAALAAASIAAAGFLAKSLKAFGLKPEEILAYKGAEGRKPRPYHLRFADQFHDVAAALAPRRMVIFVDDLDRCRPQYVLDTLEAINFLVSSGECFIVMGLAPDQVKAAVGLAFKDIADEMVKLQPEPPVAGVDAKDGEGRERREHYAREYLYKLVNLEIPVAEVGAAAAVNVLAGVGVETKGGVGRMAALKPYAAVAAFVGVLAGSFLLAQRAATDIQAGIEKRKVTIDTIAREKAAPPRVPGGHAAARPGIAAGVSAPAETIGHPPGVVPPTNPTPHPVRYLLAVPLAVALFASLIWVLRFRIGIIVSDSDEFTRALAHWQPVLSQLFSTPRALKRFLNRLRYFAMLQRKEQPERSVWGAIIGRLRSKKTPPEVLETGIRESALVALAALDAAAQQPGVQGAAECKAAHTAKFGDSLDEGQRLLFATLSQGVKVG